VSKYGYERAGKVTPAVPDEVMSFVVRGFGYAIEHLAELRAGQVVLLRARPGLCGGLAAASPVVAICGQRVRSARPFVRVLTSPSQDSPGDRCPHCSRQLDRERAAMPPVPDPFAAAEPYIAQQP